MKHFSLLFLLIIASSIQTPSQTSESYLISIDFHKVNDLNNIEKLSLPVYHLFDNVLITKANSESILELAKLKIRFDVIDRVLPSSDYYIISPQNKSLKEIYSSIFQCDLYR